MKLDLFGEIMKYIFFILVNLLLFLSNTKAKEPTYFYNPGVKIGYQFGDNGGFVYGLEFSIMRVFDYYPSIGGKVNIDFCKGNTKLHLGAQVSHIIGFDIGPSIYFSENSTNYGYTIGLHSLIVIMPFYEYNKFFDNKNFSFSQAGAFLIVPIPSSNYHFSFH